jgi:ketosteroid isomerase-like protein
MQQTQQDRHAAETIELIRKVDDAVNRRDIDAMMSMLTEDIVWDTTTPPDGQRFEGRDAVRAAGEEFFKASPNARFESEEIVALGDRAVARWVYRWVDGDDKAGHVRGVDVYTLRDGKVAEIRSYVKG